MDSIDTALALRSLKDENAALKVLLRELEDAARYKRENELVESVKAKLIAWAKWIVALFVIATAILGITTFVGARDTAISVFQRVTEPEIKREFTQVLMPQLTKQLEADAARRVDDFTSTSAKQFDSQMNALFGDLSKFARENNLRQPTPPTPIDSTNRPNSGYVLRSFLTPSINDTYLINTFRLNLRDKPNGNIVGRQVQDVRVKITEQQGEWVRIEVHPAP